MDDPVINLLGDSAIFDPFDYTFLQLRVFVELRIPRTRIIPHQIGCGPVVAIAYLYAFIAEIVWPKFTEYSLVPALQNTRISSTGIFRDLQRSILRRSVRPS